MKNTFTLDSFKTAVKTNQEFKERIINDAYRNVDKPFCQDIFDYDNGVAIIQERNLTKYLEKYMCKNQDELSDYLYYNKGIFLKVV